MYKSVLGKINKLQKKTQQSSKWHLHFSDKLEVIFNVKTSWSS
jgi:hypothetical protein